MKKDKTKLLCKLCNIHWPRNCMSIMRTTSNGGATKNKVMVCALCAEKQFIKAFGEEPGPNMTPVFREMIACQKKLVEKQKQRFSLREIWTRIRGKTESESMMRKE